MRIACSISKGYTLAVLEVIGNIVTVELYSLFRSLETINTGRILAISLPITGLRSAQ
jgi:hypothetical protein